MGRLLLDVLALLLIGVAAVLLSGRVVVQPVLSGSMTGYADRGDLVVGKVTDATSLQVGDVILFAPPAPYGTPGGHPVAHRVQDITLVDGTPVATTKGDANPQPDPWTLDLTRTRTAEVHLVVPDAGWPFLRLRLLATPAGRMATGVGMMATGTLTLLVGRRRQRRSDEPWPPPFEEAALEAHRQRLAQRQAVAELPPAAPDAVVDPGPAYPVPTGRHRLIPRQRTRDEWRPEPWSVEEALAHAPIEWRPGTPASPSRPQATRAAGRRSAPSRVDPVRAGRDRA